MWKEESKTERKEGGWGVFGAGGKECARRRKRKRIEPIGNGFKEQHDRKACKRKREANLTSQGLLPFTKDQYNQHPHPP